MLCLVLPQPGGESLPRHETGIPRHRLGRCQVPPLLDVDVVRSLYRPLRSAMAYDDAHRIRPPSSMVSCVRRVQFHREAPPREIADPRRWTQPLTCRSPTPGRHSPSSSATRGRRRSPEKSPVNYILLRTSAATLCGSFSATSTRIKQAAASVWRLSKAAPSASWAPIMAIARRQQAPFSPKVRGIPCPSILWALYLPSDATSS